MYIDEDGQVAHEFYEEDKNGRLQRVHRDLRPQVWHHTNLLFFLADVLICREWLKLTHHN